MDRVLANQKSGNKTPGASPFTYILDGCFMPVRVYNVASDDEDPCVCVCVFSRMGWKGGKDSGKGAVVGEGGEI